MLIDFENALQNCLPEHEMKCHYYDPNILTKFKVTNGIQTYTIFMLHTYRQLCLCPHLYLIKPFQIALQTSWIGLFLENLSVGYYLFTHRLQLKFLKKNGAFCSFLHFLNVFVSLHITHLKKLNISCNFAIS